MGASLWAEQPPAHRDRTARDLTMDDLALPRRDGDRCRSLRPPAEVRLASRTYLVQPTDRRRVGRASHNLWIVGNLPRDLIKSLDELVERGPGLS